MPRFQKTIQKITLLGDGGWGTTLAIYLARKKYAPTLWGAFPDYVRKVAKNRTNDKFLPGIKIPTSVTLTSKLNEAVKPADLIVLAVPSQYLAAVVRRLKTYDLSGKIILSVTKGIDTKHLLRMSQIITKELGDIPLAVLSGPTIATEVVNGIPSTAVIASRDLKIAEVLQQIFNSETFRIYTNNDIVGVELGGSLKNIIAIACGVCDGLGYGTNTKAAILTRGLVEMSRLGEKLGANPRTFAGLTGLGDLVTTCFSERSRNRSVGEQLGKGKTLKQILSSMNMVAEGVETARAAYRLSTKCGVSMPITTEVYNVLFRNKKAAKAVADLMNRQTRSE